MKRKLLALLGLFFLAAPAVVRAQSGSGGGYDYIINPGGTTITLTNYNGTATAVTIPTNINGLTVTGVGDAVDNAQDSVFSTSLTAITIPTSVTSIGAFASEFCINLTSVTIPNSVGYIGAEAFSQCDALTSVVIPGSVTNIQDNAFANSINLVTAIRLSEAAFVKRV